ncbi:gpW family protein [Mesorhizobium sp. C280B]|uniref:gpW family head-tail joining protein n=1 Tax=unclassified Mesorhizobium TaxID=325217 RepID=UPI0003CE216F|nr:gpW family head-tail joining protein [Mesorhizobium sp. LSJC280B00]ESW92925.1 hypothetical protein X772_02935 [Mesorhizobium sp. LSJC280B00]
MAIDFDLIFGVEEYDPCIALVALRPAYMKASVGGQVTEITFRDRTVKYSAGDFAMFGALIARLESECAAKRGRGPTRFAITGGYRQDTWPGRRIR